MGRTRRTAWCSRATTTFTEGVEYNDGKGHTSFLPDIFTAVERPAESRKLAGEQLQKAIREYDGKKLMAMHLPPGMFAGHAAQASASTDPLCPSPNLGVCHQGVSGARADQTHREVWDDHGRRQA